MASSHGQRAQQRERAVALDPDATDDAVEVVAGSEDLDTLLDEVGGR